MTSVATPDYTSFHPGYALTRDFMSVVRESAWNDCINSVWYILMTFMWDCSGDHIIYLLIQKPWSVPSFANLDRAMRLSVAQLLEVPVENRLVSAAHSASASVKSVLEKRSVNIDQAIAACRSRLSTAVGTMGITKMWDSSDSDPFIANYYLYNIRHNFFLRRNCFFLQLSVRYCHENIEWNQKVQRRLKYRTAEIKRVWTFRFAFGSWHGG